MKKPVRVLQVMYEMGIGGIETWLMNILRNIDRRRFRMDFLVYTSHPRFHDAEIKALGSRIIPCPHPATGIEHAIGLNHILTHEGPYDVVHAHGTHSVGRTLSAAAAAGVPIRIAHSHNDFRRVKGSWRNRLFKPLLRHWITKSMTVGLGASREACLALFGENWAVDPRCRVLHYGIDWTPYREPVRTAEIRQELSLPQDSLVIGHIGRFVPQKNHDFLVDVAQAILQQRQDARFLMVGDGALKPSIEEKVNRLGMKKAFRFLGERADAWKLLQAMDVFLFPSFYEGLGIALLEAQAVGLPCVISDTIPAEATVVAGQVFRLPLSTSPNYWSATVLEAAAQSREQNHGPAWNRIANSNFSLQKNLDVLSKIYTGEAV